MWSEIVIVNLVLLTGVGIGFLMGWILKGGDYGQSGQKNQG